LFAIRDKLVIKTIQITAGKPIAVLQIGYFVHPAKKDASCFKDLCIECSNLFPLLL
jgi:hypothetical protein